MIEFDFSEVDAVIKAYAKTAKNTEKIISLAVNRAGKSTLTQAKRSISKQMGIPQARVTPALRFKNHSSKLYIVIEGRGFALPLKYFKARQLKKGVVAHPWKKKELRKSAFMVNKLGNHVFIRKTTRRLPIKQQFGPPITAGLIRTVVLEEMGEKFFETLNKRVLHEITRSLSK